MTIQMENMMKSASQERRQIVEKSTEEEEAVEVWMEKNLQKNVLKNGISPDQDLDQGKSKSTKSFILTLFSLSLYITILTR